MAIGWLDCKHLQRQVALAGICRMPVAVLTDIHPVEFFDEPDCRCTSKKENGGWQDSATLKFLAAEPLPRGVDIGFIVTDVNGQSFLIGSRERPCVLPETEHRLGSPSGDAAGFYYEIKHTALKSLIPCHI